MKHSRTVGPGGLTRVVHGVADVVVDRMSATQRVAVGAVAGLFAVAPFGAWAPVVTEPEPLVTGEAIEVGPFEVTVLRAVTADDLGVLSPREEGNHLLAVVVEVFNTGETPAYPVTLTNAFPAPADAGIVTTGGLGGRPTVLSVADATSLDIVNPGLTYELALIWEQDGDWAQDELTLDVLELTWIDEDLTGGFVSGHWSPLGEVAQHGRVAVETGDEQ